MIEIIKQAVQRILENEEISEGKSVRFFISEEEPSFEQITKRRSEEDSTYVDVVLYEYSDSERWEIQFYGINYKTTISGTLFSALRRLEPLVAGVVETIIEGVPAFSYTVTK